MSRLTVFVPPSRVARAKCRFSAEFFKSLVRFFTTKTAEKASNLQTFGELTLRYHTAGTRSHLNVTSQSNPSK
jgi:hypothetical protein